ncbi:MAG: rod-binding protein [Sphingomonadales bacterium]
MADNTLISGALAAVDNRTIEAPQATANQKKASETAETFEAVFLAQMLNQMFESVKTDGPFGGGFSEGIFRSMLNDQYAETLSSRGGIGIADAVYREILKTQEV